MNEDERIMLNTFDNLFESNVIDHITLDMPLIKNILYMLGEIPSKPSSKYKKVMNKQIKVSNALTKTLTDKQLKLFNEYKKLYNQTSKLTDEQLFCFGYIFAKEFDLEGNLIKNDNSKEDSKDM